PPVDFITPKIDGRVTSYFEWQAAGCYLTEAGGTGTMHRAQNLLRAIYYGYDLQNLYFRLDLSRPLDDPQLESITFKVLFIHPEGYEAVLKLPRGRPASLQWTQKEGAEPPKIKDLASVAAQKIIEFGIPLAHLPALKGDFEWVIILEKEGLEQERWPSDST